MHLVCLPGTDIECLSGLVSSISATTAGWLRWRPGHQSPHLSLSFDHSASLLSSMCCKRPQPDPQAISTDFVLLISQNITSSLGTCCYKATTQQQALAMVPSGWVHCCGASALNLLGGALARADWQHVCLQSNR